MTAVPTVGVDDDLAARQAAITHRTPDDEASGRVDVELGVRPQEACRDDLLHDLLDHRLAQSLIGHLGRVLGRDDDASHRDRLAILVLDGHLRLRVGPQEVEHALLADLGQVLHQVVRERNRQRHQLGRLVAGEAEHEPLVAGALVELARAIHAHRDVRRLTVDRRQDGAGLVVETHLRGRVADLLDRLAGEFGIGDARVGRDLAGDDNHSGLAEHLAGDARLGVVADDLVDDGVGDLVAHLVGMPLGDGFRGE